MHSGECEVTSEQLMSPALTVHLIFFQKSLSVNVELTVLTSPAAMDTLGSFGPHPRTKIPGVWH